VQWDPTSLGAVGQSWTPGPLATPADDVDAGAEELLAYPSVTLLLERLRTAGVMTSGNAYDAVALAAICRRLDGIPLAIELAASRARLLGVRGLQARLERSLELLTGGPRDAPPRHQALRMTFDWSYALLADSDKRIFRHLGVFVGGCTYDHAARVCEARVDDIGFLDALSRTIESGLVRRVELAGAAEPRLALLEPVREYAPERLQACDEADLAQQRHANALLELCELARGHAETSVVQAWLAVLKLEHANALVALRWFIDRGDAESSLRLAVALSKYWWVRGYVREDLDRLTKPLELPFAEPAGGSLRQAPAAALIEKGSAMFYLGDYTAAAA
jgi:predicted ATPase